MSNGLVMDNPIHILITLPFSEELISPLRKISPRLKIELARAKNAGEIADSIWERVEILYTNYVLPDPKIAVN